MKWIEIKFNNNHWLQFKLTTQEIEKVLQAFKAEEIYQIFDSEGNQDRHHINMSKVLEIVILK